MSSLKSGRYKVSVLDETSKAAFFLQRLGRQAVKVSGAAFVGKHARSCSTLRAGQWFFYSTPGKKSYFIVVA